MDIRRRDVMAQVVAKRVYEITLEGQTFLITNARGRSFYGPAQWKEMKAGYAGGEILSHRPLNAEEIYDALERGAKFFDDCVKITT